MPGADATSDAVAAFVDEVTDALTRAAARQRPASPPTLDRADVVNEAFNLVTAFIDADGRHADEELWALTRAFGPMMGSYLTRATPADLRGSDIVAGKGSWLLAPSPMFELLVAGGDGTGAWTYYRRALDLLHTIASLEVVTTQSELDAISGFRNVLLHRMRAAGHEPPPRPPDSAVDRPTPARPTDTPAEPVEDLLSELDSLIGLAAVKARVRQLTDLLRVQQLRRDRGLTNVEVSHHLVFVGNPGTGKTTVARLMGRLYRSLGVVPTGHLVETGRSDLVAGFIGQTAPLVTARFDEADGGLLFIDEAYSLARGGENDFGREAIDTIVKLTEDRRSRVPVVMAGYPVEMTALLDSNPGLRSRFPTVIEFDDYDTDDLITIFRSIGDAHSYQLSTDAETALRSLLEDTPRTQGFGNGRYVRNLFEAAVAHQASRVVGLADPSDADLMALNAEDMSAAGAGAKPKEQTS